MEKIVKLKKTINSPIPSGLIVTLLAYLFGQLGTFIYNYYFTTNISINEAFNNSIAYFEYSIKIKWVLLITILILTIRFFINRFNNRKSKYLFQNVDKNEPIGKFKAGELQNILLSIQLEIPNRLQTPEIKRLDLLNLFLLYQPTFNLGISNLSGFEDSVFLYYKLGPQLMSYGLTEKIEKKKQFKLIENDEFEEVIQTSELGYKFSAYLEKVNLYLNLEKQ